ncbi:MAG: hypothetical protein ACTSU4_08420 [Promethearchaeota archaeon]
MVLKDNEEKNKISVGLLITNQQLFENPFFPDEIKEEIMNAPYYLLIYISREDVVKVSCFPTDKANVKKILIKLKEFSPDLVKGISKVLNDLNLSNNILHTTGLCYDLEKCFYETYLTADLIESGQLTAQTIKDKFMEVPNITNVFIENVRALF